MSDWHPEDIKAEIRKRGKTLAELALKAGMTRQAFCHVLAVPTLRAEEAIAEFLGVSPRTIWPSRYNSNGKRKQPQPAANYRRRPRFANVA